jgi:hypothetical protein
MSVTSVAVLVGAAVLSFAAYRNRRERFWIVLGAIFAIGLVLSLIRNGLTTSIQVDIGDAMVFVVGVVAAAEAFGLPRRLAAPLGLGLRSRQWEFDRKLADLARPLGPLLEGLSLDAGEGGLSGWDSAAVEDGRARLAAIARLKPPDERWRALTTSYLKIYGAYLDSIESSSPGHVSPSVEAMTKAADEELQQLRASYRADADRLAKASIAARLLGKRRD